MRKGGLFIMSKSSRNTGPKKRTDHRRRRRERRLSIRSELRRQPDVNKIAESLVAMAIAQAEKEAEEQRTRLNDGGNDDSV